MTDLQAITDDLINTIQNHIDELNTLKLQKDIPLDFINNTITQLQQKQVELQDMTFIETENSPALTAALYTINECNSALKEEVSYISDTTARELKINTYVTYASDVVSALKSIAVL